MSKKKKTDLSISASSACGTISSNCCDLSTSLNYLGSATAADGTSVNVISTSTGITAQEAYDTLTCATLDTSTVITTDTGVSNSCVGTYYYPWGSLINDLTINTTPNVLSWPVTRIGTNAGSLSVDLSGIDWSDCFRLKSNRRRLTLNFYL